MICLFLSSGSVYSLELNCKFHSFLSEVNGKKTDHEVDKDDIFSIYHEPENQWLWEYPTDALHDDINVWKEKNNYSYNKSDDFVSSKREYEQKNEQLNNIYPKDDTKEFEWTAYIQDNVEGKEKYYKIPMISCSGKEGLPKAIQSKNDRHILGALIKGKMERSGALKKYELITQETLASYGKDYIELHKLNSKEYFMEF